MQLANFLSPSILGVNVLNGVGHSTQADRTCSLQKNDWL